MLVEIIDVCSIAAVAVLTAAGVAAALVIVLGRWGVHNYGVKRALLILHDDSSIAASFFHALALVGAVTVATA